MPGKTIKEKKKKDTGPYHRGNPYITNGNGQKKGQPRDLIKQVYGMRLEKQMPFPVFNQIPNIRQMQMQHRNNFQHRVDSFKLNHTVGKNLTQSTNIFREVVKTDTIQKRLKKLANGSVDKKSKDKKPNEPTSITANGIGIYETDDHKRKPYEHEALFGKPPFFFILIAPPGAGKTNLFVYMVNVLFKSLYKSENIYIFTGNNKLDDTILKNTSIPEENFHTDKGDGKDDEEGDGKDDDEKMHAVDDGSALIKKILDLLEKQSERIKAGGKDGAEHILLVLEDLGGAKMFMHDKVLTTIVGLMRHLNFSLIITTWGLSMIPFDLRRMQNGMAVFRLANGGEEKAVFDQLSLAWLAKESDNRINGSRIQMKKVYNFILSSPDGEDDEKEDRSHNFLWFNRRAKSKQEFRDGLFKIISIPKDDGPITSEFIPGYSIEDISKMVYSGKEKSK